ncbi:hypothetical protein DFH08DRAFT_808171 [Mycena albidolilacea]|uniref:Uncharacterized protein n=1 Tax=Mycena albidolilacea TaxID=1033008 RepID=A0AAD7ERS7_9AGAR|nr:hypothetical protein DFH08DRAFT_808171 [Mycena albidolilacea]
MFTVQCHWITVGGLSICDGLHLCRSEAKACLVYQKLGDPLTEEERKISEDFVVTCQRLAMSSNRDPLRQPYASEIELAAVLTRVTQSVPLMARLSMEGRWNDTMEVVEDARRNLSLLDLVHCIGRIVEDEVNPELSSQEVVARNYTRQWVAANN